jgi:F0F1-type ATP synthase membrane subunit c/vacuolar-type H+-ATPase subunit K
MSFLKNLVKKAGNTVKDIGKGLAKAKNVLLPIAGVAVGLALPGVGGAIGNILSKGKDVLEKADKAQKKTAGIFGIGDGKPGVAGIGDGKPGVFGIGTGKDVLGTKKAEQPYTVQGGYGEPDTEKKGISPALLGLGGLAAFLLLKK